MYWELIINGKLWPVVQDIFIAVLILSFFCYLVDGLIKRYWKGGRVR